MSTAPTRERIFCNACKLKSWHEVLAAKIVSGHSPEDEPDHQWWESEFSMWQCCGCESITFRVFSRSSDEPEGYVSYYPERSSNLVGRKVYFNIPFKLDALYYEVVRSFNNENHLLCAGGLRALLEGVCLNKGITKGLTQDGKIRENLEGKINGLKEIIPASIVDKLHGFRFLGNAALHELETPRREDLVLAIEVMEDILNVVYELDYKTARLYRQVIKGKGGIPPDDSTTP